MIQTTAVAFLIQLFIIFGKFHIHKVKWNKKTLNFTLFKIEFKTLYKCIINLKNKKATKNQITIDKYNIIDWTLSQKFWLINAPSCMAILLLFLC